jgi:serine protease Do
MTGTAVLPGIVFSIALGMASCHGRSETAAGAPSTASEPAPVVALATVANATDLETAFAEAAEAVKPAVVSITTVRKVKSIGTSSLPFDDPFFRRFFGTPQPHGELEQRGLGSGVIIDSEGHILTNNHVVKDADELKVQLSDDREVAASIVGTDPKTDLAVIKIEADKLEPATLGDSEKLRVGQMVLAVGSPFGLSQTVSAGIVSATGRGNVGIADYEDFIQTDAAVNPGNSGGPLIDLAGNVVGVNTAIASRTGVYNGVSFAIPSHIAHSVLRQLIDKGEVVRGWLGVLIGELTPDLAESFDYDGKGGILVQDVVAEGPGNEAGLENGDIIVERDGKPVHDVAEFRNEIALTAPGTKVALEIWRGGSHRDLTVELGELPDDGKGGPHAVSSSDTVGLTLSDVTPRLRERLDIEAEQGVVVVGVEPGSLAAEAGLRTGDVIERIGTEKVEDAAAARKQLAKADMERGVRLRVRSGEYGHFVVLRSGK